MLSSPASLEDRWLVADLGLEVQDDSAPGLAVPAQSEAEVSLKTPCSPGAPFPGVQAHPLASRIGQSLWAPSSVTQQALLDQHKRQQNKIVKSMDSAARLPGLNPTYHLLAS